MFHLKRLAFGLLALGALALGSPAMALTPVVTQPGVAAANNFSGTIAVTNTFQSVFNASDKRLGCAVQNNGAATMWVFFGPVANATKATSVVLASGQSLTCGSEGTIAKDQVSITGTSTQAFFASQDGGPTIAGGGSGGGGGGGGAVTIGDGADVAEGSTTDAASTAAGAGTVSAKLRRLTAQLPAALDANGNLKSTLFDSAGVALTYNANGQASAANSTPVVGATGTIAGGSTGTAGSAASNVVTVQGVASMTPVQVTEAPVTSGGLTVYFVQPAASDNHVNIKNGAGQVYHIAVTNNSATINYLRLYNAATGFNGCNSATNLVTQLAIPASTSGAGFVEDIAQGYAFSTGISICVTSGYATNDTTNATASAMSVSVGYK